MYIIKFLIAFIKNKRIQNALNDAYKNDSIIEKLSYTFGVQFRKDMIGRLYAVINPVIRDGQFQIEQTFEYTEVGYNNDEFIKKWMVERLLAMDAFLKTNNLFDILSYKLNKLDEYGNYLLILMPYTLENVKQTGKKALIEFIVLIFICIFLIFFL